jgi:PAS domain S-box-containing protein
MNSDVIKTKYKDQLTEENALLLRILQGTSHETGDAFFRSLVKELALVLNTYGALVADYLPDRKQLRPRAYWLGDDWVEPGVYDIAGTPCQGVIENGELFQIPDYVIEHFPHNPFLREHQLMSYTGMPFKDTQGNIIGHLAVMDSKPIPDEARFMTLFEIFGARAAAEMRRIKAENEVREREERLQRLIDGAMDGIVDFDKSLHIHLANRSALQMFDAVDADMRKTPLQQWLTPAGYQLILTWIADFQRSPAHNRQTWIGQGLEGKRRNGETFKIEATLSQGSEEEMSSYTLILRDAQALKEAEQQIQHLQQEAELLREKLQVLFQNGEIIGNSPAIRAALEKVGQVAETDATVLLLGETGVGKELFARAIHQHSRRKDAHIITVNCAAIPRDLVESEFFGHTRGAFTGATAPRDGRFQQADGGTIFLDEVGELPLDVQAKLLRVLQEGEFQPVGSSQMHKVDVRIIAATNRDLADAVNKGLFREDLYYRLNVFPIAIPPLRDRGDDILLLADFFAETIAKRLGRINKSIAREHVQRLMRYNWRGNVRELQNIIEHAVITSQDKLLHPEVSLQATPSPTLSDVSPTVGAVIMTADEMRHAQRENIRRALEACEWKVSGADGAASVLGIKPSTLRSQMKALNIEVPRR